MTVVCDGWPVKGVHPSIVLRDDGLDDGKVSHTMCPECYAREMNELDDLTESVTAATGRHERTAMKSANASQKSFGDYLFGPVMTAIYWILAIGSLLLMVSGSAAADERPTTMTALLKQNKALRKMDREVTECFARAYTAPDPKGKMLVKNQAVYDVCIQFQKNFLMIVNNILHPGPKDETLLDSTVTIPIHATNVAVGGWHWSYKPHRPLNALVTGLNIGDAASTLHAWLALKNNKDYAFKETNPIMANTGRFIAFKVGTSVAAKLMADKLRRDGHPLGATVVQLAVSSALASITVHNELLLQRIGR